MREYIAKRLLMFIPVLIGVSLIVFLLLRVLPGDVALVILVGEGGMGQASEERLKELRHKLGLDRPLYVQYFDWVWGLVRLEWGKSLYTDRPILGEVAKRFPTTVELAFLTVFFSMAIAIPIGVISALRQDTWVDYIFRVITVGGVAMPTFWTGTLILLFLVTFFSWAPPLGFTSILKDPGKNLEQIIWPGVALGYFMSAVVGRMTRSCMLEVLRQDYIRTAWSKGLRERVIVLRHALKNALLPIVTIAGVQVAVMLGGSVIMETLFSLPGIGLHLIDSIYSRDYPTIQTILVLFAFIVMVVNLIVDLLYGWLDPRTRYT